MPTRCRSNCTTNKSIASCNSADKCSYTNGPKRKFCRLSSKYKMNKPDCNITRKFLKREKGPAAKIGKFLTRKYKSRKANPNTLVPSFFPPNGPSDEEIAKFKNKVQTRRLARFMKAVDPHKRRARYLNGVCSDSGVCIAFGTKDTTTIMKHFDGFSNFKHVKSIRKIGAVSANGFVKELEYENAGYKSHAVLKSSTTDDSDNLYYEYLVGLFLNKLNQTVPLFLTTYGSFRYKTEQDYEEMKKLTSTTDALNGLLLVRNIETLDDFIDEDLISESCEDPRHLSVLIQHLKNAKTLKECTSPTFMKVELPFILFQIYYVLSGLQDIFTHNDLHLENVLVYEPVADSYIHYLYHMADGSIISFYSRYIVKIIDYGRCYFYNIEAHEKSPIRDSYTIHKILCRYSKCDPRCGSDKGYSAIHPHSTASSAVENVSQDLRLLHMVTKAANQFYGYDDFCKTVKKENPDLADLCNKVVFKNTYHTPSVTVCEYPNKIVNAFDAFHALHDFIISANVKEANATHYAGKKCLGELHIDPNAPLKFIPAI